MLPARKNTFKNFTPSDAMKILDCVILRLLPAVVPEVLVYDAPDVSCREILQAPRRTAEAWRFALKPIPFTGGENWLLGRK